MRRGKRSARSTPASSSLLSRRPTTFFVELGLSPLTHLVPLVLGGVLAAPFGGWAVKRISPQLLMRGVGLLIVVLSVYQIVRCCSERATERKWQSPRFVPMPKEPHVIPKEPPVTEPPVKDPQPYNDPPQQPTPEPGPTFR